VPFDEISPRLANDTSPGRSMFEHAPSVAGTLVVDQASRAAVARDIGGVVSMLPAAVLRPKSVEDVTRMVRFCHQHGIRVAARGQGHTTLGQAQVQGGLVIDMRSLATIHAIEHDHAIVDAGVTWRQLLSETTARGLAPPVLTGFQGLSVGGTLSVGGISGVAYNKGAQVDQVLELEVVSGEGILQRCSVNENRPLFDAVLAGLGRCGLIVRATVRLVRAPASVRHTLFSYQELGPFLDGLRTLAREGSLDGVSGTITLDADGARYELNALGFFTPPEVPPVPSSGQPSLAAARTSTSDLDFLEYYLQVDRLIDRLHETGGWHDVAHPWFDVFLPDRSLDSFVAETLATLDPLEDVGPPALGALGQIHLFPLVARHLSRPMLRVPSGDLVFLFDILTSAHVAGHHPDYIARMLRRNRRLFERARELGATRYNISAIQFSEHDWREQLGPVYPAFASLKRTVDPRNILG
jgi:cytokinin dehydrogenase